MHHSNIKIQSDTSSEREICLFDSKQHRWNGTSIEYNSAHKHPNMKATPSNSFLDGGGDFGEWYFGWAVH